MEDRGRKKQLRDEFQTLRILRIRTAYLKVKIREDRRRKIVKIATVERAK